MKKLILSVLLMGQFLTIGMAESSGSSSKTNCKNLQPEKPCYDSCGNYTHSVPFDGSCDDDKGTNGNSFIDNLTYSYMHDALDYSSRASNEGCSPCSGEASAKALVAPLELYRFHKFREMSQRGSFGPGIFSNHDVYMTLFELNGKPTIDVYFAADTTNRRYFLQDGKFYDTFSRTSKSLTLFTEDGSETTDFSLARTATVLTFKDVKFNFELFQEDELTYKARYTSRVDRNNKAITLNYLHGVNDNVDAEDKFKLLTISDANNRTLIFEYLAGKRSGVNVISKVILPNTSEINYIYGSTSPEQDSNDPLTKVVYPDGTESVFSFEVVGNETLAHIFEAGDEGTHRNKTVHLDNNIVENQNPTRDGQILFNQASLLINQLKIGDGSEAEQAYAI
ncbi:MAG: hypothetical protein NE330_19175 [Lentisphaeraceae bacterium]|nr:hypothetical protein [Lentisphaeraceae bacterium]